VSSIDNQEEVKKAERREKDLRKQELNDIRTVLSNASGRRLVWRLLSKCNSFNSVFSKDHSHMSYLAGRQDFGHFIMSEITEADENLLVKLMKDNSKEKQL
jgi:hypothetical protein